MNLLKLALLCVVKGVFLSGAVESCNEFVCGSVVSKCLLTQSCHCSLTDCFCCKDCISCLGDLYTECCSCLEMCPTQNGTLSPKSQIGDFDGIPALFETLTEVDDDNKWTIYRIPVVATLKRKYDITSHLTHAAADYGDDIDREAAETKAALKVPIASCTVIFLNKCSSTRKCIEYCESMGAKSYRWFHDGCCECIGTGCINYGINESRCLECPELESETETEPEPEEESDDKQHDLDGFEEDYDSEEIWDYGEEDLNYNF